MTPITAALLMLFAASPARTDYETLCGAKLKDLGAPAFGARLKQSETRELLSALGNVNPADQGTMLRQSAAHEGLTHCALADEYDAKAGIDPITGCQTTSDYCAPKALDAAFAVAFEKRADRATKHVHVNLRAGTPLVVPPGLKSVTRLQLNAEMGALDLTALAALPALTELRIDSATFGSLAPLSKLAHLKLLSLTHAKMSKPLDLGFAAHLDALRELELSLAGETAPTSLAPLATLGGLEVLVLIGVRTADCAPIGKLTNLRKLDAPARVKAVVAMPIGSVVQYEESGGDASFVAGLVKLEELRLQGAGLTDLTPLSRLERLTNLELAWNRKLSDLRPLAGLSALTRLDISQTSVSSLAPIATLTSLHSLDANRCPITDLTPLAHLEKLEGLNLGGTKATSLKALYGLKELVNVTVPDVSDAELEAFKAAVPRSYPQR